MTTHGDTGQGRRSGMSLRWHLLVFAMLFGGQLLGLRSESADLPSDITDSVEVQNIGYSLAHGRGYRFDWDDRGWRAPYEAANRYGTLTGALARHGSHPTLYRPPLMPLMVAAVTRVVPETMIFFAWRVVDAACFAAATCLLCDAAVTLAGAGAGLLVLALACSDPLRRHFIPGWWTEGLAFDLVGVIVWLMVDRRPSLRPGRFRVAAGVTVGLLCLDRAIFVPLLPILCPLLAMAPGNSGSGWTRRARGAAAILAVACLVQSPWWIRNVAVAGRMVPLGTQGGFNLPDEYGSWAVVHHGEWTGRGIIDAWRPDPSSPVSLPPPYTPAEFDRLWGTWQWRAVTLAPLCTSTESELAVARAGQRAAVAWARAHPAEIPALALAKARTLFRDHWAIPALTLAMSIVAIAAGTVPRRSVTLLVGLFLTYVAGVAATHVVYERFLIPLLPPAYLLCAAGAAAPFGRAVALRRRLQRDRGDAT